MKTCMEAEWEKTATLLANEGLRVRALNAELVAALDECIVSMAEHNEAENCAWDFGDGFGGSLDRARAAIAKAKEEVS